MESQSYIYDNYANWYKYFPKLKLMDDKQKLLWYYTNKEN